MNQSRTEPALIREIREQPEAVRRTLEDLRKRPPVPGGGPVLLAGSGTSRHAAELAALWMRAGGIEARAWPATEEADIRGIQTLVAITQSGTTASIIRMLGQTRGVHRLVLTNQPDSPAIRGAETAWITAAGQESAIPATKSFTSALAALLLLGRDLGAKVPDPEEAPSLIEAGLREGEAIWSFLEPLPPRTLWFFMAKTSLLPLGNEAALKMMETAGVPALALPAGELPHGPAAILSPQTPVVFLGEVARRSLATAKAAGAPVLLLEGDAPPGLEAFRLAPVIQQLAWSEGVTRGHNVDAPPGLSKSVMDD